MLVFRVMGLEPSIFNPFQRSSRYSSTVSLLRKSQTRAYLKSFKAVVGISTVYFTVHFSTSGTMSISGMSGEIGAGVTVGGRGFISLGSNKKGRTKGFLAPGPFISLTFTGAAG